MTHERTHTIPLAGNEARCEPTKGCVIRGRCARYQAELKQGSPLGDYSILQNGGGALCPGFLDSGLIRSAASQKPTRPIHKPIGALGT